MNKTKRIFIIAVSVVALLLLAAFGFFLCRGGHHAFAVYRAVENWLMAESSDQQIQAEFDGFQLDAHLYWEDRGGSRIWGLEQDEFRVYLWDDVLYTDSGAAYAVDPLPQVENPMLRFMTAMLIGGHIEKDDDRYLLRMELTDLTLSAEISVAEDGSFQSGTLHYDSDSVNLRASAEKRMTRSHRLPQRVLDAMVRAEMEAPIPIREPLTTLIDALRCWDMKCYDSTLSIECGILNVSQKGQLLLADDEAILEYEGYTLNIRLPDTLADADPTVMALAVLYGAEYTVDGSISRFHMALPAEETAELTEKLIPQAADLGFTFETCEAELIVKDETLSSVTIRASGTVPFLLTTIPITFTAQFLVNA